MNKKQTRQLTLTIALAIVLAILGCVFIPDTLLLKIGPFLILISVVTAAVDFHMRRTEHSVVLSDGAQAEYYITYVGVRSLKPKGSFEFVGYGADDKCNHIQIWKRKN